MNTSDEEDLTVVVRYFLSFGAQGGRDGLTLQARVVEIPAYCPVRGIFYCERFGGDL